MWGLRGEQDSVTLQEPPVQREDRGGGQEATVVSTSVAQLPPSCESHGLLPILSWEAVQLSSAEGPRSTSPGECTTVLRL